MIRLVDLYKSPGLWCETVFHGNSMTKTGRNVTDSTTARGRPRAHRAQWSGDHEGRRGSPAINEPRLLTFREVGAALGCSSSAIRGRLRRGVLPLEVVGAGAASRIRRSDLEAYLDRPVVVPELPPRRKPGPKAKSEPPRVSVTITVDHIPGGWRARCRRGFGIDETFRRLDEVVPAVQSDIAGGMAGLVEQTDVVVHLEGYVVGVASAAVAAVRSAQFQAERHPGPDTAQVLMLTVLDIPRQLRGCGLTPRDRRYLLGDEVVQLVDEARVWQRGKRAEYEAGRTKLNR